MKPERVAQDRAGAGAFIVGVLGFCVLVSAELTLAGMGAVIAVTALICWAMVTQLHKI